MCGQRARIGCRGNCVESCELSSDRVAENLFPQAFELGDSLSDDRDASRFLGIGDQADSSECVSGFFHVIRSRYARNSLFPAGPRKGDSVTPRQASMGRSVATKLSRQAITRA